MTDRTPGKSGFFIAPFGIDGKSVGVAYWDASRLSKKWLATCTTFLEEHGAAIVTICVKGKVVSSLLLLSGRAQATEADVAKMFVESLQRTFLVKASATIPDSFEEFLQCNERPLAVVVAWPEQAVSDEDHDLVRELGIHLAGAFLM